MNRKLLKYLLTVFITCYFQLLNGSGFALIEQSVPSMGTAYAGGAAQAHDNTTIFFNPAGLTRFCYSQVTAGAHVLIPSAKFNDKGSVSILNEPLTGGDGGNAGEAALVGHFYASKPINRCLFVGLGIFSPFGLVTDYKDSWKGRYHAIRSSLVTVNINPCIAIRLSECWSVGAGFNAMYLHAKLSNAIDFGLIAQENGINGAIPQGQDGRVKLKGNSWGYGGNLGILYQPSYNMRFGIHYRSGVTQKISGSEKFEEIPDIITGSQLNPVFQDTRAHTKVKLPKSLSFSAYYDCNCCWSFMVDGTWTRWVKLDTLVFEFDNERQPDNVTTLLWQNSWRYAVGAIYRPFRCWEFRSGVAFDNTPIQNKVLRTPRIPGEDRFWLTIGAGYNWNHCLIMDLVMLIYL